MKNVICPSCNRDLLAEAEELAELNDGKPIQYCPYCGGTLAGKAEDEMPLLPEPYKHCLGIEIGGMLLDQNFSIIIDPECWRLMEHDDARAIREEFCYHCESCHFEGRYLQEYPGHCVACGEPFVHWEMNEDCTRGKLKDKEPVLYLVPFTNRKAAHDAKTMMRPIS